MREHEEDEGNIFARHAGETTLDMGHEVYVKVRGSAKESLSSSSLGSRIRMFTH